jgi:hypothetical protein
MYRGGDRTLVDSRWVQTHIHGHGPLGDLYPDYNGGDIWSRTLGQVRGIKEGDTPSFLALLPNGLTDLSRPERGSWGGRFEGAVTRLSDVADADVTSADDPDPRISSVYRWRPTFQADFQARLDWCIKPYSEANHPPVARIDGDRERRAKPGETITLDAGGSSDPDGDRLTFAWSIYPAEPPLNHLVTIAGNERKVAGITLSAELAGKTVPVLLTVTDSGQPRLSRYARLILHIEPAGGG